MNPLGKKVSTGLVMFNLVYSSNAAKAFSNAELFEMLERWRTKNARLGVTGLLIYRDGAFIQSLEGEESAVRAVYARIQTDDRHFQVYTLRAVSVPDRQFPDWSMGFKNLDGVDVASIPGYDPHPIVPGADEEMTVRASVALRLLTWYAQKP